VTLHDRLMAARADTAALDRKAESDLIVDLAPHVEDFLGSACSASSRKSATCRRDTTNWRRFIR
jgi:hypothetical protein